MHGMPSDPGNVPNLFGETPTSFETTFIMDGSITRTGDYQAAEAARASSVQPYDTPSNTVQRPVIISPISVAEVLDCLHGPLTPGEAATPREREILAQRMELLTKQGTNSRTLVASEAWMDFVHLPDMSDCGRIDSLATKIDLPDFALGKAANLLGFREDDARTVTTMLSKASEAVFPPVKPLRWAANTIRGAHLIICSEKANCPNARKLANDLADIINDILMRVGKAH